jgi:glycosyltransferase involved in cell wall biosynthesis
LKQRKTLIVVTPGFPESEADTTCLPAFQQFVSLLKKTEYNIIVVSLHYPFKKNRYYWNGIPVFAIGGSNKGRFIGIRTRFLAYRTLLKLHQENELIGILSLWCIDSALVANRFSLKYQVKHFIWIIGQDAKQSNGYVKRINPLAKQLIAMSDFLKVEFYKNHHVLPQHVVKNGINELVFEPLNTSNRPIDVFGAGNLTSLKNYELFIEVIAEVIKYHPQLVVKIAGKGEQEVYLNDCIVTHNLQNNLQLIGEVKHDEVLKLMNQSKIFLHTSQYEGNSTVLMEALYNGCEVVSTQSLSMKSIPRLYVESSRQDLVKKLNELLNANKPAVRVIFNTMNDSVNNMLGLFECD